MRQDILDHIECALTLAGYEVLAADGTSLVLRAPESDKDYQLTVTDDPG